MRDLQFRSHFSPVIADAAISHIGNSNFKELKICETEETYAINNHKEELKALAQY